MDSIFKQLTKELNIFNLQNSDRIAEKMYRFMDLVLERNENINLTTVTEKDEFIKRHLIDSVSCYGWPEIVASNKIVDVGTGAGFPGIPLALCYPEKNFLLVDSLGKRIDFINDAIRELEISNVQTLHARAEDAGRNPYIRDKYDLCITRALAPLNILLEYCLPMVKPEGYLYAYKTKKAVEEIEDANLALRLLGASTDVEIRQYDKRRIENREKEGIEKESLYSLNIFIIRKVSETPKEYPRKAGTPKKIPL